MKKELEGYRFHRTVRVEAGKPATGSKSVTMTIHDAENMTNGRRKEIAVWLRKRADCLVKNGHNYTKRFTAAFYE